MSHMQPQDCVDGCCDTSCGCILTPIIRRGRLGDIDVITPGFECYFYVNYVAFDSCTNTIPSNLQVTLTELPSTVLYTGAADNIPVQWPAKNGATYTLRISQAAGYGNGQCGESIATLTIPLNACPCLPPCHYGPATWDISLSGCADVTVSIPQILLNTDFRDAAAVMREHRVDSSQLNHSISAPIVWRGICPQPTVRTTAYRIGTVTLQSTIVRGCTPQTAESVWEVYGLLGQTSAFNLPPIAWPPTPRTGIFEFSAPEWQMIARIQSVTGINNTAGPCFNVPPGPTFFGQHIFLYPRTADRLNGNCSTGRGILGNDHVIVACPCYCGTATGADYSLTNVNSLAVSHAVPDCRTTALFQGGPVVNTCTDPRVHPDFANATMFSGANIRLGGRWGTAGRREVC